MKLKFFCVVMSITIFLLTFIQSYEYSSKNTIEYWKNNDVCKYK